MSRRYSRIPAFLVTGVTCILVIVLDRVTKDLAVTYLSDGSSQQVIPGVVDFLLVYNQGAAWGMFGGGRYLFVAVAAVAVIAILVYLAATKKHAALPLLFCGLLAGGAIGNGIDRALSGRVVDFIHPLFIDFPLFNVADCAITFGVILMFVVVLFGGRARPKGEETEKREASQGQAEPEDVS